MIRESRAISLANDTEQQPQEVAGNPRRRRFSTETLENADYSSSTADRRKQPRSRENIAQHSEGNIFITATTNMYRGSNKYYNCTASETDEERERRPTFDASKSDEEMRETLEVYSQNYLLRCSDRQQELHDLYNARQEYLSNGLDQPLNHEQRWVLL